MAPPYDPGPARIGRFERRVSACIGLVGAALVLVATSKYGISHHSDSARYVSVARSLAAGSGFVMYDGQVEVYSTPLYPAVLSVGVLAGFDPLAFARFVHAVLFGAALTIGVSWLRRFAATRAMWLVGALMLLASYALFAEATEALTDMLFITLTVWWLYAMDTYCRSGCPTRQLLIAGLAAALAWLARYVGVTLVFSGVVLILLSRGLSWRRRIRDSVLFGVVASLLNVAWLVRNYLTVGEAISTNPPPTMTFGDYSEAIAQIIGTWFVTWHFPNAAAVGVGAGILLCIATAFVGLAGGIRRIVPPVFRERASSLLTASCFVLVYTLFVNITISLTFRTDWPSRYLAPLVIPVVALLIAGADAVYRAAARVRRALAWAILLISAAALTPRLYYLARAVQYAQRHGAGGIASDRWQTSELAQYLRRNPPQREFFTNEPNALYFLADTHLGRWLPAHGVPGTPTDPVASLRRFRDSLPAAIAQQVVLFHPVPPGSGYYDYSRRDLEAVFKTSLVVTVGDGSVYTIQTPVLRPSEHPGGAPLRTPPARPY